VTWDDARWKLETTYPDAGHYQSRANLANGYIGINVAALGPFFEVDEPVNGDNINGWPLFDRRQTFATVAGFFDLQSHTAGTNYEWLSQYGGESVISGLPHWSNLVLEYEGHFLNATTDLAQVKNFSSSLDLRSAILSWKYTWNPPGSAGFDVVFSMFLHKLYINQAAVQLKVVSNSPASLIVHDILEGDSAVRTDYVGKGCENQNGTIWAAVSPQSISNVTGYVYSTITSNKHSHITCDEMNDFRVNANQSSISQAMTLDLGARETFIVSKYLGIASTDAFENPQVVAHDASIRGSTIGFQKLLRSHIAEWHRIMPADSVDSFRDPQTKQLPDDANILESQILAITNTFFLLQNTISQKAMILAGNNSNLGSQSISVCGLSSSCYAGMIFWDVEVWMAPGLVVAFPEAVRQIAEYRRAKYPQALENVHQAFTSSQAGRYFAPNSAIYPWTSGRFGNATATGPAWDYEYHLNGDIALELKNYYIVTGDSQTFKMEYQPVYESLTQMYSDLLLLNETIGKYTLLNATDPDEYANHVDNPGYTMTLIKTQLETANELRVRFNQPVNTFWAMQAANVLIPTNDIADIILEYTGMNGTINVKQADVVLVDDLLDYQNNYTLSDLDYYAGKQSQNGPGMTYSVFSVVASSASPAGCSAYTYDLYSSEPYVRAPWFQFSEQLNDNYNTNGLTHPAYPFLTGMGGNNRVSVFGYLGLRLELNSFSINPSIPPQVQYIRYRTIYWQGHAIAASSNQTHTTLRRLSRALQNANSTFTQSPIPVTIAFDPTVHNLYRNASLVFPNRQVGLIKTIPGNIAQCQPAVSAQEYVAGQFPLAAVDGAVSTTWQPLYANQSATLNVTLGAAGASQPIIGFAFDWAQNPPQSYSISFTNSSSSTATAELIEVYASQAVAVSMPYNALESARILPYMSNTTNVTLASTVYGGKFALLTIYGSQESSSNDGAGATVAEWAIIAEGSLPLMTRYHGAT